MPSHPSLDRLRNSMAIFLCILAISGTLAGNSYSQCVADFELSCGPGPFNVSLDGSKSISGGTSYDFNSGTLPPGWSAGGGFTINPPECAKAFPGWNGTAFYWASAPVGCLRLSEI